MNPHVRANLLLLVGTLSTGAVLYPLVVWAVGQVAFPASANGSLIAKADGQVVGSGRIAQGFTAEEYFWPRPSAVSYNAAAAGASNWGATNPKLRGRVAQQLGPLVRYRAGSRFATGPAAVQNDITAWLAACEPTRPELAEKHAQAVRDGTAIPAAFFDLWLQDPANGERAADLEPVPADLVLASGSGLDPDITLRNAKSVYQLDRVAAKRGISRAQILRLLEERAFAPLGGLAGESLVNVLEINLELDQKFPVPAAK